MLEGWAASYAYAFDDPLAPISLPCAPFTPAMKSYHAAEIAYVFQRPRAFADPHDFDEKQQALSERIQHAWGAFAHTGRPSAMGLCRCGRSLTALGHTRFPRKRPTTSRTLLSGIAVHSRMPWATEIYVMSSVNRSSFSFLSWLPPLSKR